MDDPRRLFFGVALPSALAARVGGAVAAAFANDRGLKLSAACDLHVTLVFLGAFPADRVEALAARAAAAVRDAPAPALSLGPPGAFPSARHPRVLYVGVEEEGTRGRLLAARERVFAAALAEGWQPSAAEVERPYVPHVTVARVRDGRPRPAFLRLADLAALALAPERRFLAGEIALFETRPVPGGGRYPRVATVPLARPPDAADGGAR